MVRLVSITLPAAKADVVFPLLFRLQEEEKIFQYQVQLQSMINFATPSAMWAIQANSETTKSTSSFSTDSTSNNVEEGSHLQQMLLLTFKTKDKLLKDVLVAFERKGIGSKVGQIDVVALVLSKPAMWNIFSRDQGIAPEDAGRMRSDSVESSTSTYDLFTPITSMFSTITGKSSHEKEKSSRKYRISDRMTIEEIESFIDDGNHLTFNYLALLSCASMIAGAGLLGNSATTVIASMLVSPLMGPILSITFGMAIRHQPTIHRGLRNELVGILVSFVMGLTIGVIGSFCYSANYRSDEMVGRGSTSNLLYGLVVAFASGIAVVLGITMGGVNAIVGTAISASLLPPIVNSGMCLAMAVMYQLQRNEVNGSNSNDYYTYSGVSYVLL